MRIGFLLDNQKFKQVNCLDLQNGNPGIGGTQYSILSLIYHLSVTDLTNEYFLLVNFSDNLPGEIQSLVYESNEDIPKVIIDNQIDILILTHSSAYSDIKSLEHFNIAGCKVIIWAHNFVSRKCLNNYSGFKNIVHIVCVGHEQLDLYRDHKAFKKSTAIYNGVFSQLLNSIESGKFKNRGKEVTYIGSLIAEKGFHKLAAAWKNILDVHPTAHLNVIGSGNLYNRSTKLGHFGFAAFDYEESFMKFLLDTDGNIIPSVRFWGVLGSQKNEILARTKVGVPNPSGVSETFGYSAIEMQMFGALVTTKECPGYLETVYSDSILFKRDEELSKSVNYLLSRSDYDASETIKFIYDNFAYEIVAPKWVNLFKEIKLGKEEWNSHIIANMNFKYKWLRELNHKIKDFLPFGYRILPSVMFFEGLAYKLKVCLKKYLA